jgi:hypothetical protein
MCPEDWGIPFLWNVGTFVPEYKASHPIGSNLMLTNLRPKISYIQLCRETGAEICYQSVLACWALHWISVSCIHLGVYIQQQLFKVELLYSYRPIAKGLLSILTFLKKLSPYMNQNSREGVYVAVYLYNVITNASGCVNRCTQYWSHFKTRDRRIIWVHKIYYQKNLVDYVWIWQRIQNQTWVYSCTMK